MRTYTPRELRQAVLIAVLLTALAMLALLDPTCRPTDDGGHSAGPRSIYSR